MSSIIIITCSILLSLVLIFGIFKKTRLNRIVTAQGLKTNIFMTPEEAIEMVVKKTALSDEEIIAFQEINAIYTGTKMQHIFEDPDILEKWFIESLRAVNHVQELHPSRKDTLSYTIYEIRRKIANIIAIENPSIKRSIDISVGQKITMTINKISADGTIIGNTFNNISISSSDPEMQNFTKTQLVNKMLKVNFWKAMDAGYSFQSQIKSVLIKESLYTIVIYAPEKTTCVETRKYTRKSAEIPAKFSVGTFHNQGMVNTDTPTSSSHQLGIINNISANGCSLLSRHTLKPDVLLEIEFPIFDKMLFVKGSVVSVRSYGLMKLAHIEFEQNTNQEYLLQIYRFIFANRDI